MALSEGIRSTRKRRVNAANPADRLVQKSTSPGHLDRRQDAHNPIDQAPQIGTDLASGRGGAIDGGANPTDTQPTATGGGLASDGEDHGDPAPSVSTSIHDTPSSTPPVHTTQAAPTTAHVPDNSNNNDNNADQSHQQPNNQGDQHTSSQQQQPQYQQPSSSPQNHDTANANNGGNNQQQQQTSSSQHNTWQQMTSSSSSSAASPPVSSATSVSDPNAASSGTSIAATTSAAAASVSANGITDTANAVDTNNATSDVAATNGKSSSKLGAGGTAGIVLAILAVLALGAGLFIYRRRRQAERSGNNRKYGNVRIMSERYSNASSFYGVPNASSGSGGFITFQDNASTHTRTTHVATLPGSPSGGSMMYNAPAPAPDAAALSLRQEQPDEDDFSHYDQETVDTHGDLGQPSSTYYTPGQVTPYDSRAPRMPEYNLPHPPIPAFDSQEAILASKASSSNMAYIASGRPVYRRAADERKGSNRSVSSQNSYVDEQLRDLYVDHY